MCSLFDHSVKACAFNLSLLRRAAPAQRYRRNIYDLEGPFLPL